MYKIMLAEDEAEVLNAIVETTDWQAFGFEKPVACHDGQEALDILQGGFVPDVLLTDIRMPFVDGLELAKHLAENHPKTVVVILSGHDEFVYAQKALKLKVYDYVLKPLTPKSLNELLTKVSEELDARRLSDIEDSMHVLKSHFLHKLSIKQIDERNVAENCRRHQLEFEGNCHLAVVLDTDYIAGVDETAYTMSLELFRYALSNITEEMCMVKKNIISYQAQDGTTRLIISGDDPEECRKTAEEFSRDVALIVQKNLSGTVSAGIGDSVHKIGDIYRSHVQALTALSYRFFQGKSSVLFYNDIREHENCPSEKLDASTIYQSFQDAVMRCSFDDASAVIVELFKKLAENHCSIEQCIACCQRLIMILLHFSDKFGENQNGESVEQILTGAALFEITILAQMEEKMLSICEKSIINFRPVQSDSAHEVAVRAVAYINENYADPQLSLQTITEHLSVSVSHFSSLFKSYTGGTFVEYLTRERMDKAKHLLAFSDLLSYEVAYKVGFGDPHYFSIAFKRFTGMSPREFREHVQEQ